MIKFEFMFGCRICRPATMCDYCKSVLVGYRIPHAPTSCPLKSTDYCFGCFQYGHRSATCPHKEPATHRTDPVVLTQIPAPLPGHSTIQLVKHEHVLSAYLRRHKIHPRGSLEDMMFQVYELASKLKVRPEHVQFIEPPKQLKSLDN